MYPTTISFRLDGTELPSRPPGHQPDCRVTDYMVAGLYGHAECSCLLDPQAPAKYYRRMLTPEELAVWLTHFDVVAIQESDPSHWTGNSFDITDEAAKDLADAVCSGLFDLLEVWENKDDDYITVFVGFVNLSLDAKDGRRVAYLISAITDGEFDESSFSAPREQAEPVDSEDGVHDPLGRVALAYYDFCQRAVTAPRDTTPQRVQWFLLAALGVAIVIALTLVALTRR